MKNSDSSKATIKIQTSEANALRWKQSASRLGLTRNQYLLALLSGPTQPVPLATERSRD